MSDYRREMELIMRAQFQGKETLDGVIKSIGGIEEAIKKQSEAAKRGEVSLDQLKSSSTKLVQAQEALKSFAKLFDNFEDAPRKVQAASDALERAKVKLNEYRASLDATKAPTDAQAEKLLKLGQAVDRASARYDKSRATLAELEAQLKRAGVATDQLSTASTRVRTTMTSSVESYQRAQTAIQNYDAAQQRAAKGKNFFNDNGRTTLSLLQRIRGEILSVTAAYVGLYGAINGASKSIEAYNEKQGVLNMLTIQTGGDREAAMKEYEYIREQADRLGISLQEAAKGYAKFSAAATFAGRSVQENRFVFESVAEVGRVAQLGSEQMQRIFYAISQIDSKGKVMAEEFNQQLGDALPGLTGVAKKATEGIFEDFNKAMKDGKVSLDIFVDILARYRELVSGQLPAAVTSLQADQERFNNSLYEFKVLIAESGFADSFKLLISDLTTFFRSSDGKAFAKSIADAFTTVADVVRFVIKYLDEIVLILEIIATVYAAKLAANLGFAFGNMVKGLIALRAELAAASISLATMSTTAAGATLALKSLLAAATAFSIGWSIGEYLYEQSETVRKYSQLIIGSLDFLFTAYSGFFKIGKAMMTGGDWRKVRQEVQAELDNIKRTMREIYNSDEASAREAARANGSTRFDANGIPLPGTSATGRGTTPKPTTQTDPRRSALLDAIDAQLDKLETNVKRKMPGAMDAIKTEYEGLLKQINELGGKEGEKELKRLEALHNKQIASENTYAVKYKALIEQINTDVANANEEAGKRDTESFKARLDGLLRDIDTKYAPTFKKIAEARDGAVRFGESPAALDAQKAQLELDVKLLRNFAEKKAAAAELKRLEQEANDILENRNKLIEAEQALNQAGSQTQDQTQVNIERIRQRALDQFAKLRDEANQFTKEEAAAFDPETLKVFDATLANVLSNLKKANKELVSAERVANMVADGATPAFETMASSIWGLMSNTKSWGDAIRDVRNAFLNFVADFLREIANMMIRQAIFNAMMKEGRNGGSGSGSSYGGLIATFVNSLFGSGDAGVGSTGGGYMDAGTPVSSGVAHTGGIIGVSTTSRAAVASWFDNAPRYHRGGIPGLAPDEYATILKKNEEVLTSDSPRNILNGGAGVGQQSQPSVKVMNMIDSQSVVSEGLASQQGEIAVLNVIRANASAIKTVLGR